MNQSRREFLGSLGALTAFGLTGMLNCSRQNVGRPNIVLILADDQGYADVGVFGAKGFQTPNLDRLAREGLKFTSFYVSQAVCSASRAALMTGCYSERVSIKGALGPNAEIGLNPAETTIADMLKQRGYATGVFGKWHLGHHREFLPLQQGFDEYLGLPYSNDMWPVDYDGRELSPEDPGQRPWKAQFPKLPLIQNNEKIAEIRTLDDQATLTTRYTEAAVKFIEKNKSRPFFLYMPHSMPHVPLGVSAKYKGKSDQGMYGDVIMEIDWSVGQILETLKKNGLEENTLVIYTSDNGPWKNYGKHAGCADPLREAKGTMWEGGPRVPCIMRWPGKIPAGISTDKIAGTIDILPTLAMITGATLPEKKIDGVNILSLMRNEPGANPRNEYWYYYGGELRAVRRGKWKLYFPHEYRSYRGVEPGRDGYPGPYNKGKAGLELYDLEADISETEILTTRYPEVVNELMKMAEQARAELGDKLQGVTGSEVREVGRIVKPE